MTQDTTSSRKTPDPTGSASPRRRNGSAFVVSLLVVCVVAAAGATWWIGSSSYDVVSMPYPGDVSVIVMAAVRALAIIAASITVGGAVFAAFFLDLPDSGTFSVDSYRVTRLVFRAATVWAAASLFMIFATAADGAGLSIRAMFSHRSFFQLYDAVEQPKSWTVAFVAALIVAVITHVALRWVTLVATLGLSLPGAIAPGMVGNSGQGLDHDFATNFLILHSAASAVWLGVLVAAWSFLRRLGIRDAASEMGAEVLRRISRFTLVVVMVLAITGAGMTWLQVREYGWSTTYATTVLAQIAAFVLLFGLALGRVRKPLHGPAGPRQLLPDIGLVLAAVAAAAVSAVIPSPSLLTSATSSHEIYIGYNVPGAWTWTGLLSQWRVDALWLLIATAMVLGYLLAVRALRRAGETWPTSRVLLWGMGWALVVLATSSGVNTWSSAQFSMHMVLHLILNLAVAPMLVAAAPLSLVRQATPSRPGGIAGPREWVDMFLRSALVRILTTPWMALTIYVVTLFGFYFTPLFDEIIRYHWGHQWMNIHFLVTGCLFFWPIVGTDLPSRRLGNLGCIGMLFAIMPFHALFGIILMTHDTILGGTFYQAFNLMDQDALMSDQFLGGVLAWISGEIPVLVAAMILLFRWIRRELGDGGSELPSARHQRDGGDPSAELLEELQRIRR